MRFAMLMVALAACGDDSVHHLADARPGDSSLDATGDRGVAQVSISQGGAPRVGARVIITDPDGSAGGTVLTDATGLATAMVLAGGSLTADGPYMFDSIQLFTVADVQIGDLIEIAAPAASPLQTISVTLSTFAGATEYDVATSCGGGRASAVDLAGCSSTTPLLALAVDDNSTPLATIWEAHAPIAPSLDLSAVPWIATTAVAYTFANFDENPYAGFAVVANEGFIYETSTNATAGAVTLHQPTSFGTAKGIVEAVTGTVHLGDRTTHRVINAPKSVDFATRLPDLTKPNSDGAHVYWTPIGGLAEPDVAQGMVERDSDGAQRFFIAPLLGTLDSTMAGVVLPPVAGDDLSGSWSVKELSTIKAGGGEKAMRQRGFAGVLQYATDGTPSLEADYGSQVD